MRMLENQLALIRIMQLRNSNVSSLPCLFNFCFLFLIVHYIYIYEVRYWSSPRGSTEMTHIKHIRVKHTFDWGLGFNPAITDFTVLTCVYQPRSMITDLWSLIADRWSLIADRWSLVSGLWDWPLIFCDRYICKVHKRYVSRYLTSSIAALSCTEYEMLSSVLTFLASLALQMLLDTFEGYDMLHL